MNRINVCELICDSKRQAHKGYKSLSSTAVCHRWRRWLCFIPDDDHNELSLSFTGLFSRRCACWRDRQQLDTSDSQPLSGPFHPRPVTTELKKLQPQKRSGAHCFSIMVTGHHITTRAPIRILIQGLSRPARRLNNRRMESWVQHGSEFINCHNERLRSRDCPTQWTHRVKLNLAHLCFIF